MIVLDPVGAVNGRPHFNDQGAVIRDGRRNDEELRPRKLHPEVLPVVRIACTRTRCEHDTDRENDCETETRLTQSSVHLFHSSRLRVSMLPAAPYTIIYAPCHVAVMKALTGMSTASASSHAD
jgi:hypothetical protein